MKFELPNLRLSGTGLAAGAAAGVAAVLLAMVRAQHPPLTSLLGFVSPLPIMIAALAFGPWAGALALVAGAVFAAVFDMKLGHLVVAPNATGTSALTDGLLFLVLLGIPSWLLTFVARIPAPLPRAGKPPPRMRPDEVRLTRIAIAAVVFAVVAAALILVVAIVANGGIAKFDEAITAWYETAMKPMTESGSSYTTAEVHQQALLVTALMPGIVGGWLVVFYLANLWLAARIARTSGVFGSDWPDIARNFRLPRFAAVLLAVSLGLSFSTGPFAIATHVVSGAFLAVFALQGLAVIHTLTRGFSWRPAALVFTYGLLPFGLWALLALSGLLDTAFSFRDRQAPIVKKPSDKRPNERKDPWK